jgi:hypothetical protein
VCGENIRIAWSKHKVVESRLAGVSGNVIILVRWGFATWKPGRRFGGVSREGSIFTHRFSISFTHSLSGFISFIPIYSLRVR